MPSLILKTASDFHQIKRENNRYHDVTVASGRGGGLLNKAMESRGGTIDSQSLILCLAEGDPIFLIPHIFRSSIDCLHRVTRSRIWGTEGRDDRDIYSQTLKRFYITPPSH